MAQKRSDAIEQGPAATRDARHVLEDDQLWRVVLERFKRQPHPSKRQAVQRLIFVGEAKGFREEAREAFAWSRQEDDMRAFAPRGGLDVLRCRCAPP